MDAFIFIRAAVAAICLRNEEIIETIIRDAKSLPRRGVDCT
jgi:hypothetical protein